MAYAHRGFRRTQELFERAPGLGEQGRSHEFEICQSGPPALPFLTFAADEGTFARSRLFCTECCRRGVYFHPHHNWFLSAAHTEEDVGRTLEVTDEAFAAVRRELPA